jgi:cytochrome P450
VIDAAERTLQAPRRIAGHELPAGMRVYPNIVAVHYREDLYPEPTAFRPERFLDGRISTYTWLPFGGGIRRCIGAALAEAEIAEVVRVVLSRVQLRSIRPKLDPVVMRGITLVPRRGVQVEVTRRSDRGARVGTSATWQAA